MKVKIEMIVEVNDNAEDFEIESCIRDFLSEPTGNSVEFYDVKITDTKLALSKFTDEIRAVEALETFEARNTNNINGKLIENKMTFCAGVTYIAEAWRPEGMSIGGHFVFNKDASKFIKTR